MDEILNKLTALKWSTEDSEERNEDGSYACKILVSKEKDLTSVFIYTHTEYCGNIHFNPKTGYEMIQLQKRTNKGRWTAKQRERLEHLGFTIQWDYATRRNVP